MRRALSACAFIAAALVTATCGTAGPIPVPTPAPTASGPMERAQVFYASGHGAPVAVPVFIPSDAGVVARLRARFDALATGPALGPGGSFNLLSGPQARLTSISTDADLAMLDFAVVTEDWGLRDKIEVRAFVQQVVFTATDERSIYKIRLTQNEGALAVFAVDDIIVAYHAPLTREMAAPEFRADHSVAYFARDDQPPLAVFLEGAGVGDTAEERIRSRLVALENHPGSEAIDAFNVVAGARARLDSVRIDGDLVVVDYRVPEGDWGVDGSARLRPFVEQLVYTASEEPGIVRVLITQNGGRTAVIGGEGLVIDHPTTREEMARE